MGEGDIQYKKTRGWKWTGKEVGGSGVAARLEAWANGLEAIRLTPSVTGVDIRLLGIHQRQITLSLMLVCLR